jgi:poly-beta-1,6-N-acetyl-D-glucosamine synthase
MSSRKYCLITPCRDEEKYARRTLEAVVHQSEPPALWVLVDDGSKDATPDILAGYAARFPWITVIRRPDRGGRKLGGGVIDAFYAGFDTIDPGSFEYLCKLDLDLDLPPGYFAGLMDRMEANPRIGTCSGKPYFVRPGKPGGTDLRFPLTDLSNLVSEKTGDENSVGASKFYRTACFRQIGGFVRGLMWDGIDGHRCRQLGWIAVSWDDPGLRFLHLRPMGTSHKNWWTGRARHGFGQYFMGTTPAYMLASALYRMTRPPLVIGGIAMLYGYFRSMLHGNPRYGDAEFRRFLRAYQWRCLLKGKAAATADLNARLTGRWSPAEIDQRDGGRSALPPPGSRSAMTARNAEARASPAGHPRARIRFGSIWIDSLKFAEALDEIERLIQAGEGGAVFTPNADHIVVARSNAAFRDAYARANLSLADGQPLVWASHLLRPVLPEKISGSDLVEPLMERAGLRGWRVFLVGGAPGAAKTAAKRFAGEWGVRIAGVEDGRVQLEAGPADEALLARIGEARPQLVLVALGAPKQELWIDGRRARLAPAVVMGVGAALDFLAGAVRRAPPWVRRAGLEWLYRLGQEPRRLARRYLWKDPKFFAILLQTWLSPRETRQTT